MNIGNYCQKEYDKAGNNTSYDHLVTSIDDPLIPGIIMIFEELANKMSKLLTVLNWSAHGSVSRRNMWWPCKIFHGKVYPEKCHR